MRLQAGLVLFQDRLLLFDLLCDLLQRRSALLQTVACRSVFV